MAGVRVSQRSVGSVGAGQPSRLRKTGENPAVGSFARLPNCNGLSTATGPAPPCQQLRVREPQAAAQSHAQRRRERSAPNCSLCLGGRVRKDASAAAAGCLLKAGGTARRGPRPFPCRHASPNPKPCRGAPAAAASPACRRNLAGPRRTYSRQLGFLRVQFRTHARSRLSAADIDRGVEHRLGFRPNF